LHQSPLRIGDDKSIAQHTNLPFGRSESELNSNVNPESQQTLDNLEENLGTKSVCMDLNKFGVQHKALLDGADIIAAGPPCQGFSTASKNDPDDDRNGHVWNVARIAGLSLT
ncbi:DNA cytosine methyltransferase, partial [Profundibacter sp.]